MAQQSVCSPSLWTDQNANATTCGRVRVCMLRCIGALCWSVHAMCVPYPVRIAHTDAAMESTVYWGTHAPTIPARVTHERDPATGMWGPRHTRHLYCKQTDDGRIIVGGDRRVHPEQVMGQCGQPPHSVNFCVPLTCANAAQHWPLVSVLQACYLRVRVMCCSWMLWLSLCC